MKCFAGLARVDTLPAEVDAQELVESFVVRLKVGFKAPPGSGDHLFIFALVALSGGSSLPMRQAEKPEDALVGLPRIFED
jgi:hypothetical protein